MNDLLNNICYIVTTSNISEDGIFKEITNKSCPIKCRITNANTRDLYNIQHIPDVIKEFRKLYTMPNCKHEPKYGDKIEVEGLIYDISNIYHPTDITREHHIKYLLVRTIEGSSK